MKTNAFRAAAFALFAALVFGGCATPIAYEFDSEHPSFRYSTKGILLGNRFITPDEMLDILEDNGIPHSRTINILIEDEDMKNLAPARMVLAYLAKNGYRRAIFVTERHTASESVKPGRARGRSAADNSSAPQKKTIRYKRATE